MTGAPPFQLPGPRFAGAIAWLVLGGLGLVVIAPDLAAAGFLLPRVLGVTHLYTLGVVLASAFGALYQFYPCRSAPARAAFAESRASVVRLRWKLRERTFRPCPDV